MTTTVHDGAGRADESAEAMTILVYSDDANTRQAVKQAVGRRPARDVPRVQWVECATHPAVIKALDAGGIDVCILDGESAPVGGMGISHQIKEEIYQCPPVIVLTGRVQDNWLAAWSLADAAVAHPLDPRVLADTVAAQMRTRRSAVATQ